MKNFLLTLAIEGLEDKYSILLSRGRYIYIAISLSVVILHSSVHLVLYFTLLLLLPPECTVLKNRKFVGALPEQTVRQKPKPFIIEMDK